MGKKISDEVLIFGMETFIKRLPLNNTNIDGGIIETKIGKLDGMGYIYTGMEDTNINIHGKASRGSFLKKVSAIKKILPGDIISKEAIKALTKLKGTEREYLYDIAMGLNSYKYLIYPFNFMWNTKVDDKRTVDNIHIVLSQGSTGLCIIRIKGKYDEKTKRCPLEYSFGLSNGSVVDNLRLVDYVTLWRIEDLTNNTNGIIDVLKFSDANYISTLILTDKKGTSKLVFDCTGFYFEKKGGDLLHYNFLFNPGMKCSEGLITNLRSTMEEYGVPKKWIDYMTVKGNGTSSASSLVDTKIDALLKHQRFIVPYGCGDVNIIYI